MANTFITCMLKWRLSRDSKRWSVVQHIFVSFAAMVSIHKCTRVPIKFTVGGIIEVIAMHVPDQYIWSESNLKQKMSAVCSVYNDSS